MILDRISFPANLRFLTNEELDKLAEEMRDVIIRKVDNTGGHLGPNLGIIETTIAMHYVFNAPLDKIIFDVSHQCYPHKILTGRKDGFNFSKRYLKYSGYTAPEESLYDLFKVGHTSTSISLATGIAKSRDIKGEKYNVIAIIGDGSLTGGEALEGLNNAAVLGSNIIIVVNDNEMSIAENHGGLYTNLKNLRETKGQAQNNFFKTLGFDYRYVENGNNIAEMIEAFKTVKDIDHPTILHIHTLKGHGHKLAEENKEFYHWIMPGTANKMPEPAKYENYATLTKDFIMDKKILGEPIILVNAGTPGVFEFNKEFRDELGANYVDVGIAEEHAVASASAMAKNGAKPILCVMSSFIQRTYDQLSQDLALNNSPLTLLIYWGGLSGADATHLCSFDIPLISNIPNIVYLSPTSKEEYLAMLEWSYQQNERPVAIRVPSAFEPMVSTGIPDITNYSLLNKFELVEKGSRVAILGLGNYFHKAKEVKKAFARKGINATLINPKFMTGVDEELLNSLKSDHELVITLEDGCLSGGFGEKIARFYGNSSMKVLNYGGEKEFTDRVSMEILEKRYRLTPELILEDAQKVLATTARV